MRYFVIIGQTATASGEFLLDDLPGSSGRLDVLLRCIRAALSFSHGLRHDTRVYLVLRGGAQAPRTLRIDGASAKFIRPDERSLAILVKKTLAAAVNLPASGFVELRPGLAVSRGDWQCALPDMHGAALYWLEQSALDIRNAELAPGTMAFFLGDHHGLNAETQGELLALGAVPLSVGPVSLHSDDVVTLVGNELDRRSV